jgi:hypothetical protein
MNKISKTKMQSFSFGYQPILKNKNHELTISISQPLKLENGQIELSLPVYRTRNKEVLMMNETLDIAPDSREIHTKITFNRYVEMGHFAAVIGHRANPYHSNNFDNHWYTQISFSRALY